MDPLWIFSVLGVLLFRHSPNRGFEYDFDLHGGIKCIGFTLDLFPDSVILAYVDWRGS